jgi:hypothetical protein
MRQGRSELTKTHKNNYKQVAQTHDLREGRRNMSRNVKPHHNNTTKTTKCEKGVTKYRKTKTTPPRRRNAIQSV